MAKLIPAAERIVRARKLIQQARELRVPAEMGKWDLSYIANVRDLLRQAKDMVKFISIYGLQNIAQLYFCARNK